ncbi:hypothetical protein BGX29_012147 [Mortierella sp. GBA35]|nr:hypothetical protein BGX29_012147 [Mortierella sp. GBA35]
MTVEEQCFRQGPDGPPVFLRATFDNDIREHIIFWEDVEFAFPGVHCVKSGLTIVAFARDKQRRRIDPLCIVYEPNVVLEVVIAAAPSGGGGGGGAPGITLMSPSPPSGSSTSADTRYEDVITPPLSTSSRALVDSYNTAFVDNRYEESCALVDGSNTTSADTRSEDVTPLPSVMSLALSGRSSATSQPLLSRSLRSQRHIGPSARIEEIDSSSGESTEYSFPSSRRTHRKCRSVGPVHLGEPSLRNTDSLPPIPPRRYPSTRSNASPPPPSILTALNTIAATETTTTSVVTSRHFVQRMHSTELSFEQSIREGQIMQAKFLKQEADSIKQEMAVYYEGIHSEVAKNRELQTQMMEMQQAADKMTRRILELQEVAVDTNKRILELQEAAVDTDKWMIEMQKKALDQLAIIQSKATAILLQTYELHEYPIPRLFIILPKEDTTRREKITTLFVKRFRLYFLCECGEHTKPTDGTESRMSHEIHLARHEGYDLDRPNEFFRKYGSYILALLQMLKYGVAAAGMVVTPLNIFKVGEGMDEAEKTLKYLESNIGPMVDDAIKYLEGLSSIQEGTTRLPEVGSTNSSETPLPEPVVMKKLEALEGADLRNLKSFLKCRDEAKVLGNLYRTVTAEGHVKWVCLDHYRETYRASALQEFCNNLETNDGHYDDRCGRVTIRLTSPILAQQFYSNLANTRFVQELVISMAWDTSMEDFRILKSVIQQSIIYHLDIDACGFSAPTFDINRGRRWEPVLQMMGNGKLGVIAVRNMSGFLLRSGKVSGPLQVRVLDMSDQFVPIEEFSKLRKLLLVSPNLSELSLFVPSICDAFDLVKQLKGDLKQLSTLSLKLQDGSTASVSYKKGTGEVTNIVISICGYESRRILQLPMVTAVSMFGASAQNEDTIRIALKSYQRLKSLQLTCAPHDFFRVLLFVRHIIDKDSPLNQLSLRDATHDIQVTISNFPGIDIDFGEYLIPLADFSILAAFLRKYPQLETLSFLAPSLAEGIDLVRKIVGLNGTFRNLTVRQPNGSKADVVIDPSTGEVQSIQLRVCDVESPKMLQLPNVKKVSIFLDEKRSIGELVQSVVSSYSSLETIEFLDLDMEARESLKALQQAAQVFSNWDHRSSSPNYQPRDDSQEVPIRKAGSSLMVDLPDEFVTLSNAFLEVFWMSDPPLIISSADGFSISDDNPTSLTTLTFALQRHDGSMASIRIDSNIDHDSSILLHICDYESVDSLAPVSGTSLTIMAKRSSLPLDDLTTLAVLFLDQRMTYLTFLKTLGTVQEASIQCQSLRVFKDWGLERSRFMGHFDIPVTLLDATRHSFSIEDMPVLDKLLCSCSQLHELSIQVSQLWETFEVVRKASLLHKRLSRAVIAREQDQDRVSVLFEEGTGEPLELKLDIRSYSSPKIFFLPKVLALSISDNHADYRMEDLVFRGLKKFQDLRTLEIKTLAPQFFASLLTVQKAMQDQRALTMVEIWGFVDNKTKSRFDLPLTDLDLTERILETHELGLLAKVLEVSPMVKELKLFVPTIHDTFDGLRLIVKRLKTLSRIALACPDGSGALVQFDGTEGDVTSIGLHLPRDAVFVSQPASLDSSDDTGLYQVLQTRRLLELPDSTLKVFESVQRATIDNPSLLQVKVLNGDNPIAYDIPIHQWSTGRGILAVKTDVPKLNRVIAYCPWLTVLDLLVPVVSTAFLPIFSMAKNHLHLVSVIIRHSDGSRATISFKTSGGGTKTMVTLRFPDAAPTRLDIRKSLLPPKVALSSQTSNHSDGVEPTDKTGSLLTPTPLELRTLQQPPTLPPPPPPPFFSILRLPEKIFDALEVVLRTGEEDHHFQMIEIANSADAVLSSFAMPVRSLNLGSIVVTQKDSARLERFLSATMQHITTLEFSVDRIAQNIEFILRTFRSNKQLTTFIINHMDGGHASYGVLPGTSRIVSAALQMPSDFSGTIYTREQGIVGVYAGSVEVVDSDAIFQLRDLSDPELRIFAGAQQFASRSCALRQFLVKDARTNAEATIPIPIREMDLSHRVLTKDGTLVLAMLLGYCPLLSEVLITVESLESTAILFAKVLPDCLKSLSVVSVRQSNDATVSFNRESRGGAVPQIEHITIQTYTLPSTSNLLQLPRVRELTLLDPGSSTETEARVADITEIVRTAIVHFSTLESLDIRCSDTMFASIQESLAGLLDKEVAFPFQLHLTDKISNKSFTSPGTSARFGGGTLKVSRKKSGQLATVVTPQPKEE